MRYGAAILTAGRRRDTLTADMERMMGEAFEDRILPFDSAAAFGGPANRPGGRPNRVDCPVPRHGPSDTQTAGLQGHRRRGGRSVDGGMSGTTEAFARVKIYALLKDAGWNLTDGSSVLFEHALPDGTQSDYVLCDQQSRPVAALKAKRASTHPVAAQDQGLLA